MTPLNLMTMIGKSLTYPLKDVTGSSFCHIQTFLDLSSSNYAVFLSFFVTLFRYFCLFQKEELLKWKLSPKVSLTVWTSNVVPAEIVRRPPGDPLQGVSGGVPGYSG